MPAQNSKNRWAAEMTDNSSVILEKRGQAFWITINRPDKRNALNADVIAGIARGPMSMTAPSSAEVLLMSVSSEAGLIVPHQPGARCPAAPVRPRLQADRESMASKAFAFAHRVACMKVST